MMGGGVIRGNRGKAGREDGGLMTDGGILQGNIRNYC